jgi:hypothetical protein
MSVSMISGVIRRTAAMAAITAIVGAGLFFAGSASAQASALCSGTEVAHASMIDVEGSGLVRGTLNYISYAGPVKTLGSAAGVCIKAFGGIDTGSEYASAFIVGHCGS